jgi:NTP pyrophosphatase (non-canonical NTP hydrolase)
MLMSEIMREIWDERARQDALQASGKFDYTCATKGVDLNRKMTILLEEVGEVAHAINEKDNDSLVEELIQVAAVTVAWLESLE